MGIYDSGRLGDDNGFLVVNGDDRNDNAHRFVLMLSLPALDEAVDAQTAKNNGSSGDDKHCKNYRRVESEC